MEAIKIVKENGNTDFFGGFDHLVVKRAKWAKGENGRIGVIIGDSQISFPDKIILNMSDVDKIKEGDPCKMLMLNSPRDFRNIATDAKTYILGTKGETIEAIHY